MGMNLANGLLKIFSFNFGQNYDQEILPKIQSTSVACFVLITASVLLTIYVVLLSNPKFGRNLNYFVVITAGITSIYLLAFGNNIILSTIALSIFPIITIGALGYNRGSAFSLFIGLFLVFFLFLPLTVNAGLTEQSIGIKIIIILSYILVILSLFIYDTIKVKILRNLEKQVLDHKSALKLKEDFIANLSHQIRTPLNNIMVVANILENISSDEKQKDMIDTIHASTNNLVNVVNSMVEISNVDIKERGSINITFNLHTTINSTIKLFSTQNSSQTTFALKIDDSMPQNLIGDPVRIKQIFLNLIESILKNKSSSKTNVTIKVTKSKETDDTIEFFVELSSNKPIHLPLNEGHNLFVTNESSLTSASTQMYIDLLELSITQKLIESNGGKLSITLTADNASFSFPYSLNKLISKEDTKSVDLNDKITPSDHDLQLSSSVELENSNVLLVEDNLINQKIVVLSLKKLVKTIEIANNGKEALDKFGTSRYDIILMDIQMPIMNGIVATKKIREIEASSNSHTPIIAITANALLGDKEECLAAGMDDYISKPFQIEVLIQKMKNLLKSS
jgi:CheY-like chemotaxis protein/signal transduction histidine kinase